MASRTRVLLVAAAAASWAAGCGRPAPKGPNIVLISIDALRADHLSVYGYPRDTTPSLSRFAREAVVFERHRCAGSWTMPSHMSMFTGLYPPYHGLTGAAERSTADYWLGRAADLGAWLRMRWTSGNRPLEPTLRRDRLAVGLRLMAEILRGAGYRTAAFAASDNLPGDQGFARGFGVYRLDLWARAEEQNKAALEWLRSLGGRPFFLFLHYNDVHDSLDQTKSTPETLLYDCPGPDQFRYVPKPRGSFRGTRREIPLYPETSLTAPERARVVALYDGCIRYADEQLGRFLRDLKASGLYDRTVVVVTADHGELLGEHGLYGHINEHFIELVRAPLLLRVPGRPAGVRRRFLTSGVDILPTILEAAGVPADEATAARLQGRSLLGPAGSRVAYTDTDRPMIERSLETAEGWTLQEDLSRGSRRLFDLRTDPRQRRDLFESRPRETAELEELLQAHAQGSAWH